MTEETIWSGGPSPGSLYWYWIIGLVFNIFIIGAIIGIPIWIIAIIKIRRWKYEITNERVKASYGYLNTVKKEADLDRVQDVIVTHGVMGKILNYGTVFFNTAGTAGYEIVFKNVSDPEGLKEQFRELRKKQKNNSKSSEDKL